MTSCARHAVVVLFHQVPRRRDAGVTDAGSVRQIPS